MRSLAPLPAAASRAKFPAPGPTHVLEAPRLALLAGASREVLVPSLGAPSPSGAAPSPAGLGLFTHVLRRARPGGSLTHDSCPPP